MMKTTTIFTILAMGIYACLVLGGSAGAVQFSFIDPNYTQEIFAGPPGVVGIPGAFTSGGNLLARVNTGPDIVEYSTTPNTVYHGTNLHGVTATHTIANLAIGAGITKGTDGYLYLPTTVGLQRVDPSNWAAPAVTLTSFGSPAGYGVNTLPNGNIVYTSGANNNIVHIYDPSSTIDTVVYTHPALLDDIETNSSGLIALASPNSGDKTITLLTSTGSFLQTFSSPNGPDGMAFGTFGSNPAMYSSDNAGTITRYEFGSGYSAAPTLTTVIASGGSYGDIAVVGPDCAFYLIQAFSTKWDDNTTTNENSIVRIAGVNPDGSPACLFVPEPAACTLLLGAIAPLFFCRARRSN